MAAESTHSRIYRVTQPALSRRRAILQLCMLSLLLNGIMPIFASGSSSFDQVLICTSQGYRWVDLATVSDSPTSGDVRCAYCIAATDDHSLDATSAETVAVYDLRYRALLVAASIDALSGSSPAFYTLTRAPPIPLS